MAELSAVEKETLVMLLRIGLRSRVIAERLTAADLHSRQVAARMRTLAGRGLVGYVPSPAARTGA
jgi:hypothetical protein